MGYVNSWCKFNDNSIIIAIFAKKLNVFMTKKLFALCVLSLIAALAWGQSPVVKVEEGPHGDTMYAGKI